MSNNNSVFKFDAEHIYVFSVVLAMGLLLFANSGNIAPPGMETKTLGIGKAFYVPCFTALISSFFLKKRHDNFNKLFTTLIFLGVLSSLFHPPVSSPNPLTWTLTRFTLGILCFKDLKDINPYLFAKITTIISPLIIVLHYILTNPLGYGIYRYAGFYGDPNFFAIAMILIIVCCYITILNENSIFFSLIGYFSIIGAIPLIFFGMSRGGLIGLALIMFVILSNLRKTNKKLFFLILILFAFSIGSILSEFSDLFASISSRFMNESESDERSTMARVNGIKYVITIFTNNLALIPFGVGLGNTVHTASEYSQYGASISAEIHNTFFSLLYEGGLILVSVYLYIYIKIFKSLYRCKNYLLLTMLFSLFLSLNTLPGASFMPGWISLFLLCNRQLWIINNFKK